MEITFLRYEPKICVFLCCISATLCLLFAPFSLAKGPLGEVTTRRRIIEVPPNDIGEEIDHLLNKNISIGASTKELAHLALIKAKMSDAAIAKVMRQGKINIKGNFQIPLNNLVWSLLTPDLQSFLRDLHVPPHASRVGLDVTLAIDHDANLAAIANKYRMGRDPKAIEILLRKQLEASSGRAVSIPLETILPKFIRKMVNSYAPDSGPNCFNAALCVGRAAKYELTYIRGDDAQATQEVMRQELNADGYRYVGTNEKLLVGDLLIYFVKNGADFEIWHAARFLGDGIMFTKNGSASSSPFIFQPVELMERIYLQNLDYKITVFRPEIGGPPLKNLLAQPYMTGTAKAHHLGTIKCQEADWMMEPIFSPRSATASR